jgi:hypothetical protein
MKITSKTNRLITIATIVYTVFLALSFFIKIRHIILTRIQYYSLTFLLEVLFILLMIYLINILWILKEKAAIIAAFTIYTCLEVVKIIYGLLPSRFYNNLFTGSLGIFSLGISIYLLIETFSIQNRYIALPYKLFGSSLLYLLLAKLILIIAFPNAANPEMINYLDVLSLLTPIAILYILKKVTEFIKYDNDQNSRVISG